MEVPKLYMIHDLRFSKDFKGITICGYKRRDVLNAFQNSIINNKLEDAIRWCVELHSTGLNKELWKSLKNTYFNYIHINNPKLFFYLYRREKEYINIIKDYPKKHEIFSRNNQEIRNLYAELVAILTLTKKNNLFTKKSLPIINNKSFLKEDIQKRMISKDLDKITNFINNFISNNEKLALNEIINNISNDKGTFQNCVYWYLWLEKIDKNKTNKTSIILPKISDSEDSNWKFIIWNIILSFLDKLDKNDIILLKKLKSFYKENPNKNYIFISFYMFFYKINWNINLFQQEYLIIQSNGNINKMYQNIIKNIESNLSEEHKIILKENYYKILNKDNTIKKVQNTEINNVINKILLTNYPEFSKEKDEKYDQDKNELIFKNMTIKDIENNKNDINNRKIDAFNQIITLKKVENKGENKDKCENKNKNVLEYYNENHIRNINFFKKK